MDRGWSRYLLMCAFVLALHGNAMSYGLIYDDAELLRARHLAWLTGPWHFATYYRPLQALLFTPWLVSAWAPFLHLQNLLVGTFIVFLYGRLLQRLGLGSRLTFGIELACLALPTSMMMLVWVSQRTDWPTLLLGLWLLLLTFSKRLSPPSLVATFTALGGIALLCKESAVAVVGVVPLFVALHHRRWRLGVVLGLAATLLLAGYLIVRARIVHAVPVGHHPMFELALGVVEAIVYPWIHVCFTYNPLVLALNATFLLMGIGGAVSMLRESRPAAVGLIAVFIGYAGAVVKLADPRNLVVPGFVAATFAIYFVQRALERERATRGLALALLLAANLCALASLSVVCSYPLQEPIADLNLRLERLEPGRTPRGYVHEVDANTRFRLTMREALRRWYLARAHRQPAATRAGS